MLLTTVHAVAAPHFVCIFVLYYIITVLSGKRNAIRFDRIVNEFLFNVCICFHNNRDKSQGNSCCIIRFFSNDSFFYIIKSCENQPTLQLKSSYLKKNVWNSNYRSSKNWRKLTVRRQFSLYASFIFDWISFVNYAQFWSHFNRFFFVFWLLFSGFLYFGRSWSIFVLNFIEILFL